MASDKGGYFYSPIVGLPILFPQLLTSFAGGSSELLSPAIGTSKPHPQRFRYVQRRLALITITESRRKNIMRHKIVIPIINTFLIFLLIIGESYAVPFSVENVSPDSGAPILGGGRNTSSGGRVNNLSVDPSNPSVLYAASEWGGLWKTLDGGGTWFRLENHKPFATWDIAVHPGNTGTVYATSFYDGRSESLAGISVSKDGGATWTHPADSIPPAAQCSSARRSEPSAFGIGVDPAAPNNAYIGTNCGLAISTDSGQTWTHVMPSGAPSRNIRDVVAHNNGIIDVCGDDGHFRSTDGGGTWTAGTGLPGGACSITASPLEQDVLHATANNRLWESRDGANWNLLAVLSGNRPRWVVDGPPTGSNTFTMYYGDGVKLRSVGCDDSNTPRCNAQGPGGDTDLTGNAHDDVADVEFDASGCPLYVASDGGIYANSSCPGGITWNRAMGRYQALWIFGFGASEPLSSQTLHIGMQDNGYFSSADGGVTWQGNECCDVFDNLADDLRAVYSVCCFTPAPATRFFVADSDNPQNNLGSFGVPPGGVFSFAQLDSIDQFDDLSYVMTTANGVFITTDEGATWNQLGSNPNACGVVVSKSLTDSVTFYAKTNNCNGGGGRLLKYSGTATGGTWSAADNGLTSVGVFAVDPNDPNYLRAADLAVPPRMVISKDGGETWQPDAALDMMMTGSGDFKYTNTRGPTNFTGFGGYSQPTLLAFNPNNPDMLFAGAVDAGLFASVNDGASWIHLAGYVPRPYHAYFSMQTNDPIYIGTQGRGVFKVTLADADLQITKADQPDPVNAGDQLYYTVQVENLGPDAAEEIVVIDQLPAEVTFITDDAGICTEIEVDLLRCEFGNLVSGMARSVTIKVKVDADVLVDAGVSAIGISNSASVSGRIADPNQDNNIVTESTIVEDSADLGVVKICKPDGPMDAGETGFCEILVDNHGVSDAREVEIIDKISANRNFDITNVTASGGVGINCNPTSGSGSNEYTVTCNATSLAAGDRAVIKIDVTATEATDINDVATVLAATPDPQLGNNQFEGSISVNAIADLALAKSAPASVVAGEMLNYSVTVDNLGPSDAQNVVITDNLPAGVEVVAVSGSCIAGAPGDPFQPTICNLGSIAAGGQGGASITVKVLPDTRNGLLNDAWVSSDTVDRDNSNNNASATTAVTSLADVQIAKTDVQDPVVAGEILDYVLQVVNAGPSSALNVILHDQLPPEVNFVEAVLQDVAGSCVLLDPPETNVIECHIGEILPNATQPAFIKIKTLVKADTAPGLITNTANVESTETPEADPSNDMASETTTVETVADVSVDKSTPLDTYEPSSQIIYTVNVANSGPSDAQNVVVVDTLPLDAKKAPYLMDTGGCTYDESAHQLTCPIGTLAAQQSVSFNAHIKTKGNVGAITNSVSVNADTFDPDLSNNTFDLDNLVAGGVKENGKGGKSGSIAGAETLLITDMSVATSCNLRDLEVTFSWLPEQASPIAQLVQVSLYPGVWNAKEFGVAHMPAHAKGNRGEATVDGLETGSVYYWRVAGPNGVGGTQRFETPFCVADMHEE